MVMFQVLMILMSLVRYCHDNRLFMSTCMVCHMVSIFCRLPSRLRERERGGGVRVRAARALRAIRLTLADSEHRESNP